MTTRIVGALGLRFSVLVLTLIGVLLAPAAPATAKSDLDVWFDGERVSAFSVDTSIREFMNAFGRETGLRIRFVADAGVETVDVEIYELSLADALAAVLAHRNYTVVGDQVWISSATRLPLPVASERSQAEPSMAAGELVGVALAAGDLSSRQNAVIELTESGASNAKALARLLDAAGDEQIRLQALRGLEQLGPIDVDRLADLATDDSSQVRNQAVRLLSRRGDENAQAVLEQLSSSADAFTRVAAMQALLRIAG